MTALNESHIRNSLDELDVGGYAVVKSPQNFVVSRIERITKTMIVTKNGRRFKKSSGLLVGDEWGRYSIHPITNELYDQIVLKRRKTRLDRALVALKDGVSASEVTDDLLNQIEALVKAHTKENQ